MRDDFSGPTRDLIARRAGFRCTNPTCRKAIPLTSNASDSAPRVGVAAAIHSAVAEHPRYAPQQTSLLRPGADNGIWLCLACADTVDQNPQAYPAERLIQWRADHTDTVVGDGSVPIVPLIAVRTLSELHPTQWEPSHPNAGDLARYRDHEILVQNLGPTPITAIRLRLQFPEAVVRPVAQHVPDGITLTITPEASGSAGEGDHPGHRPHPAFHLIVSHIPSQTAVALIVRCVPDPALQQLSPRADQWCTAHFAQGTYVGSHAGETTTYDLVAAFGYDPTQRRVSVLRISDDLQALPRTDVLVRS